jgi:hypothetical protein
MLMMEVVVWGRTEEFITLIPTLIDELGCIPGKKKKIHVLLKFSSKGLFSMERIFLPLENADRQGVSCHLQTQFC